jgi:hypothetical protein
MLDMAEFMILADKRGVLRQIASYVRAETRLPEADFYDRVREAGLAWKQWPNLAYFNSVAARDFYPPGSWTPIVEEVGELAIELGVPDDSALATVLAVQRALIPLAGRSFPESLSLPHDYAQWHRQLLAAKDAFPNGGWVDQVEPLRSFGPSSFDVHDDDLVCTRVIGLRPRGGYEEVIWEMDSPVARGKQHVVLSA